MTATPRPTPPPTPPRPRPPGGPASPHPTPGPRPTGPPRGHVYRGRVATGRHRPDVAAGTAGQQARWQQRRNRVTVGVITGACVALLILWTWLVIELGS